MGYSILLTERIAPYLGLNSEMDMNMLGYEYLRLEKYDEAIAVFQMNVEAFPDSFNTYDSLGEAYAA